MLYFFYQQIDFCKRPYCYCYHEFGGDWTCWTNGTAFYSGHLDGTRNKGCKDIGDCYKCENTPQGGGPYSDAWKCPVNIEEDVDNKQGKTDNKTEKDDSKQDNVDNKPQQVTAADNKRRSLMWMLIEKLLTNN